MSKVFDIFPTPLGTYSYDSLGDVEMVTGLKI